MAALHARSQFQQLNAASLAPVASYDLAGRCRDPLAQILTGFEMGQSSCRDRHDRPGPRIASLARWSVVQAETPETTNLNAISLTKGAGQRVKDGLDRKFSVLDGKLWLPCGKPVDQLGTVHWNICVHACLGQQAPPPRTSSSGFPNVGSSESWVVRLTGGSWLSRTNAVASDGSKMRSPFEQVTPAQRFAQKAAFLNSRSRKIARQTRSGIATTTCNAHAREPSTSARVIRREYYGAKRLFDLVTAIVTNLIGGRQLSRGVGRCAVDDNSFVPQRPPPVASSLPPSICMAP